MVLVSSVALSELAQCLPEAPVGTSALFHPAPAAPSCLCRCTPLLSLPPLPCPACPQIPVRQPLMGQPEGRSGYAAYEPQWLCTAAASQPPTAQGAGAAAVGGASGTTRGLCPTRPRACDCGGGAAGLQVFLNAPPPQPSPPCVTEPTQLSLCRDAAADVPWSTAQLHRFVSLYFLMNKLDL